MIITGSTNNSRLTELKKYAVGVPFTQQYKSGGSWTTDGVDYTNSPSINYVVYYIGGIRYVDKTLSGSIHTTFSFEGQGYNSPDFIDVEIYKDPNKSKIVQNPKVDNDVFIIRQEISAFDKIYKLNEINNLQELTSYAGGKFFNIVNNT